MPSPKKRYIYDHDETQQPSAETASKTEEEHLQFELARHSGLVGKKKKYKKTTLFGFRENSKQQKMLVLQDAEIWKNM